VLSYLCAGRPILLSAPSDNLAAKTVLSAGAGIVVRPGDTDRFLEAAQQLRRTATLREQLGISGRRYANSKFDVSVISRRFEEIFKNTQKE
jgi:glycosyltransferase involved in cell wall biosynthesis